MNFTHANVVISKSNFHWWLLMLLAHCSCIIDYKIGKSLIQWLQS